MFVQSLCLELVRQGNSRGRATDKDFAHYVTMAIGSANEAEHGSLTADVIEGRKMLIGLRRD